MENNPIVRFVDEQMTETIKNIRETALANQEEINRTRDVCLKAIVRLTEMLNELPQ